MKEKAIDYWTVREFKKLPVIESAKSVKEFDSFIIIPTVKLHESGYRLMKIVIVHKYFPIGIITVPIDLIQLFGKFETLPDRFGKTVTWSVDCLHTSKLLHFFTDEALKLGNLFNTLDIYSK